MSNNQSIRAASHNPVVTGSPDIDYQGKFIIDLAARTITYDGYIDEFPAFEEYASINNGPEIEIFRAPPLPGKTSWNLIGVANVSVRKGVSP